MHSDTAPRVTSSQVRAEPSPKEQLLSKLTMA